MFMTFKSLIIHIIRAANFEDSLYVSNKVEDFIDSTEVYELLNHG